MFKHVVFHLKNILVFYEKLSLPNPDPQESRNNPKLTQTRNKQSEPNLQRQRLASTRTALVLLSLGKTG